ncbi:MAG: c-type cytochrome [Acidimicrobiales bacterium]
MTYAPVLAADFRAIGITVLAIVVVAFVGLFARNIFRSKPELGSEVELAPNRKPYLSDEELEGTKLDRSLTFALVMLGLLAIILPFYWIAEPGRQDGAEDAYQLKFETEGADIYAVTAQCVNCHAAGGVGGEAAYVLQDADGQFLANANWKAPALSDVLLRYDDDEVRYILNYGRPGSPMAAWGTEGGGPLTTQQVDNVIAYLHTLQLTNLDPVILNEQYMDDPAGLEEAMASAEEIQADIVAEVERSMEAGEFDTVGEAVFNLGLYSGYRSGSLSCARCHTAGWSLGIDVSPAVLDDGVAGCGGGNPSGIGFNLCGEGLKEHFPDDTWKRADGSWMPAEGLSDDQGAYIEAANGSKVRLDENGAPVDADGQPYVILDDPATSPAHADTTGLSAGGDPGDLASCSFVSSLWQPTGAAAYPFDPNYTLEVDDTGAFVDPPQLTPAQVPGNDVIGLGDGRLASGCDIVAMPPRTSLDQYDFVFTGAEAGAGYGRGGLSAAGMMPGFGGVLPPEYIQAVIDYERGL